VNVEKWFRFISKSCNEKADIKAIEDEIALGQIEEVIEMAKDELALIDYYHGERPNVSSVCWRVGVHNSRTTYALFAGVFCFTNTNMYLSLCLSLSLLFLQKTVCGSWWRRRSWRRTPLWARWRRASTSQVPSRV
jgi:hypothetical protein